MPPFVRIGRVDRNTKELVRCSLPFFIPLNRSELVIGSLADVPQSVVKGYKRPRLMLSLANVGSYERPLEPVKAPGRIVHGFPSFCDERCTG